MSEKPENRAVLLNVVLNDFRNDSRVIRAAQTAAEMGFRSVVLAMAGEGLPEHEQQGSFEVIRVRLRTKKWPKWRLVQLLKFLEVIVRMVVIGAKLRPRVLHSNDLNTLPISWMIRVFTGAPFVYDSHELWSESNHEKSFPPWLFRIGIAVERAFARRADDVITVCDGIADHLQKTMQIRRPRVVRNIPRLVDAKDGAEAHPLRKPLGIPPDDPVALFQGIIGSDRGLHEKVLAMKHVRNPKAHLVLLGSGGLVEILKKLVVDEGLTGKVHFHPAVPPERLLTYTRDADVGVYALPTENICLSYYFGLPNKLFEYIHGGLAVIGPNLPEMRRIVEDYKLGLTFLSTTPEAIGARIDEMLADRRVLDAYKAAAVAAAGVLNWQQESLVLASVYRELAGNALLSDRL